MRCELCQREADGLIWLRHYTPEGIRVCSGCYDLVQANRRKPYSRVMESLALAEAGYYINRKLKR
jgi:ribosome-binding protein aMBF1 (putative translation factor)